MTSRSTPAHRAPWTARAAHWLGAAFLLVCMGAAAQPAYPSRPIRLVVPYSPGGSVDHVARIISQKLGESLGQPVVVDYRPGGNTVIGTGLVAKAAPDGHTLLLTASTHVINAVVMPRLPFDSFGDFAPVATLIKSEFVLVANPSVPADSVRELIAYAKANPDALNYATSGAGNSNHLAAELFALLTGTKLHHVPYKGSASAVTDLIGGRVQIFFSVPVNVLPHVRSGRLKALATTSAEPLPGVAPIPTFAQAGVPDFKLESWQGILVPAGTPRPVIERLSGEIARILAMPEVRESLLGQGQQPFASSTQEFGALIASDTILYQRIVKASNIKLEE